MNKHLSCHDLTWMIEHGCVGVYERLITVWVVSSHAGVLFFLSRKIFSVIFPQREQTNSCGLFAWLSEFCEQLCFCEFWYSCQAPTAQRTMAQPKPGTAPYHSLPARQLILPASRHITTITTHVAAIISSALFRQPGSPIERDWWMH